LFPPGHLAFPLATAIAGEHETITIRLQLSPERLSIRIEFHGIGHIRLQHACSSIAISSYLIF